jgi:hypothetical protein
MENWVGIDGESIFQRRFPVAKRLGVRQSSGAFHSVRGPARTLAAQIAFDEF